MSIQLKDFQPMNTWKPDTDGPKWGDGEPEHLIDLSTGRRYWNESTGCVRFKCFLLTLGTPLVHAIAAIVNVAYRALKLLSFFHFWKETNQSLKERITDAGADLLRLLTSPLALVGLELAALYGLLSPYDGRKLYASTERGIYGNFILAPCFQPAPKYHALGGDPRTRNAF